MDEPAGLVLVQLRTELGRRVARNPRDVAVRCTADSSGSSRAVQALQAQSGADAPCCLLSLPSSLTVAQPRAAHPQLRPDEA